MDVTGSAAQQVTLGGSDSSLEKNNVYGIEPKVYTGGSFPSCVRTWRCCGSMTGWLRGSCMGCDQGQQNVERMVRRPVKGSQSVMQGTCIPLQCNICM